MAGGRKREWMRRKMATVAGGGGGKQSSSSSSSPPRWMLRIRALSGGLPHAGVLQLLYENVIFNLMWLLESIVVLAKLCFFFLRFGFRL
ncbi:hypothetical protein ACP4OV_021457 [Aristida adscensionis]